MWSKDGKSKDDDSSEEEEDSEEEEEDSDDEDGAGGSAAQEEANREARKAQKKARKEAAIAKAKAKTVEVGDMPTSDEESEEDDDDDMPANPNHSKAARKQAAKPVAADDADVDEVTDGVKKMAAGNRKEREAMEAAAAKERYMKMQAQGKTDEAKADLARLKVIREQRAAEAARRQVSSIQASFPSGRETCPPPET